MTLEILMKEMTKAMKEKNQFRKGILAEIVGAVKNEAIKEKTKENISEELVNRVILKELKTAKEMVDTCPVKRTDLLADYNERVSIISEFAPVMLSEREVLDKIKTLAAGMTNKGMIMKTIMPELKGKADGKIISVAVDIFMKGE